MSCEPVLAFKDLNGELHTTEEYCCKTNKKIKKDNRNKKQLEMYTRLFPEYLDRNYEHRNTRDNWYLVENFIHEISERDYVIVKETNVKNPI